MENFEIKNTETEKYNPEEHYSKEGIDYLKNSDKIEEIIYPEEECFKLKDIETEDETEQMFFKELKNNLQAPIIKDNFEDHSKRRVWRDKIGEESPEAYDIYERNRIRLNKISSVFGICEFLKDKLNQDKQQELTELLDKINKIKEDYRDMSFEEKKEIADEVHSFIYDAYQSLSK